MLKGVKKLFWEVVERLKEEVCLRDTWLCRVQIQIELFCGWSLNASEYNIYGGRPKGANRADLSIVIYNNTDCELQPLDVYF